MQVLVKVLVLTALLGGCHGEPPPREAAPPAARMAPRPPARGPVRPPPPVGTVRPPVPRVAPADPPAAPVDVPRPSPDPDSAETLEPAGPPIDGAVLAALQAELDALFTDKVLAGIELGVLAVDLESGAEIYVRNAATALNPASNEKLATTAAALHRLGTDFRFRVELVRAGSTVILRGGGDPTLTTEGLRELVTHAARVLKGVTVTDVWVDESGFAGSPLPPGFGKKKTDAAYRAATAMTVLDSATIRVELIPARPGEPVKVVVTPPGDYATIDNRGKTVAGKVAKIGVETDLEGTQTRLIVRGRLGVQAKRNSVTVRRVESPALAAGAALHALLRESGISVTGIARIGAAPPQATVLAHRESTPLSEIVAHVNKQSDNFGAEMLLRALAVAACRAPDAECRDGVTWEHGQRSVRQFLEADVGLASNAFTFTNGSGLYDGGRLSARALVAILRTLHRLPAGPAFEASLAIGGQDGTLDGRFGLTAYIGKVRGKTGTLDDVSTLAGLATTASGRTIAFAILMNHAAGKTAGMRRIQDKAVMKLIDSL